MVVDTAYYDVLGVAPTASELDIKRAYRRLAVVHHPDKNPNDPNAHATFQDIGEAYQVLADADLRRAYDKFGKDHAKPSQGFVDPSEFFTSIFGGEAFVDWIGEISLMKDITATMDIHAMGEEDEAEAVGEGDKDKTGHPGAAAGQSTAAGAPTTATMADEEQFPGMAEALRQSLREAEASASTAAAAAEAGIPVPPSSMANQKPRPMPPTATDAPPKVNTMAPSPTGLATPATSAPAFASPSPTPAVGSASNLSPRWAPPSVSASPTPSTTTTIAPGTAGGAATTTHSASGSSTPRPSTIPMRPALMDRPSDDVEPASTDDDVSRKKKSRGLSKEQREALLEYERERAAARKERVHTLATKLIDRISVWTEAERSAAVTAAFQQQIQLEVEKLKIESFGLDILHAIGQTYLAKANAVIKSAKLLGIGSWLGRIKDKGVFIKDTWDTISSAIDAQQTLEQMARLEEKGGEEWTDEKKAEYERRVTGKILTAAWRGSRYEIQSVLRDVCEEVLGDKSVAYDRRMQRAQAMVLIGEIFAAAQRTKEEESEHQVFEQLVADAAMSKNKKDKEKEKETEEKEKEKETEEKEKDKDKDKKEKDKGKKEGSS